MGEITNKKNRELEFDLKITFGVIFYSCITGTLGIICFWVIALIYTNHLDRIFFTKILLWTLFGTFNVGWRLYFYYKLKSKPGSGIIMMQGRRWQAALIAGVQWGAAGLLFLPTLDSTGQLLLLFLFVTMNYTGVPTLFASSIGFFLLWAWMWLPVIFFAHEYVRTAFLIAFPSIGLLNGLFINFSIRESIKELFVVTEQYNDKVESLDKDNEQLKLFFLAANHDLSQPIASIQHAIYTLTKQATDPALVASSLKIMRSSTTTLTRLIDDIIHFERITSGISKAELVSVSLNNVFNQVIARTAHIAKAKSIGLWARTTTRWAQTDAHVLERILGNLIENALRYTVNGSVILAARPYGNWVSIEVWDSGVGMAEKDMGDIFKVFYRRDATKEMHKGYGLGLSIVKRLADSVGGVLSVHSVQGKGSVFKLRIPVSSNNLVASTPVQVSQRMRSNQVLKGMKIAVLDDDKVLLNSIVQVLRGELALVTSATTRQELAALIEADPIGFHAIVTDWNLGTGTGEAAFNELKKIPGFNPEWIVISGDINSEITAELNARGVPVIRKPFSPEILIEKLGEIYFIPE